jgi:hypothetical protein
VVSNTHTTLARTGHGQMVAKQGKQPVTIPMPVPSSSTLASAVLDGS